MDEGKRFQIIRKSSGYRYGTEGVVTDEPTPIQEDGLNRMLDAGVLDGAEFTMMCALPGFNLVHVWAKPDYPLPLHSHDVDCLYYLVDGSIRLGTESLEPGDSFFIPADTPYTFHPGPEGAEILEFRRENPSKFKNYAKNQAFYDKAVSTIKANREGWRTAERPVRSM